MSILGDLSELGWSRLELGRRLGVHRNTVGGWRLGSADELVPEYVVAYLGAVMRVKLILDSFETEPVDRVRYLAQEFLDDEG